MFDAELPSETVSKVHLIDLAGSERADASTTAGMRLKEGANINRSLVTLGIIISSLADLSVCSGMRKPSFIPYRDSVLTWLLKDSLGGNSKTIMIATISPADVNYSETLSTLRFANRAKNIVNKPTVNEDCNVKIIRELRAEIGCLKALLSVGSLMPPSGSSVEERLQQDEARLQEMTKQWASRWKEIHTILREDTVALRKEGIGVVLDSQMPYLIRIDEDVLSTGVVLYHLKEGGTSVGTGGTEPEQDIVVHGEALQREHCVFDNHRGAVTLVPLPGARCTVNDVEVTMPYLLTQGVNIKLGKASRFHFNNPHEAAQLREKRKSGLFMSGSSSVEDSSLFSFNKDSDPSGGDTIGGSFSGETSQIVSSSHSPKDLLVSQNETDSSFSGPSESLDIPEMPWALTEHCATNIPAGDAKSLGMSFQTNLNIQREKQLSAPHKSETEAPLVDMTNEEVELKGTGVPSGLRETRELQVCCNRTSGLSNAEKKCLCHQVMGSEGSLLAEELHIQSRLPATGGGAAIVPCLTRLEHFSLRHEPLTVGGQFSEHVSSGTSVESQKPQAHPEGSAFSSSLGSLVGRVSWMLADAKQELTNSLKEQTIARGSVWYNHMCSMVKDLPLLHLVNLELITGPQANQTLNITNFHNLSNVDQSQSNVKDLKSPLRALEKQQSDGWKVCLQRLHLIPEPLLHLQSLSQQQLLSCLHSVIPTHLLMDERVVALYWLSVSSCSQPDPQPAVVVIFQTKFAVVTFDLLPDPSTYSLNLFYEASFEELMEIHIGFSGQTVRLTGNTEHSLRVLHTFNAAISQELCSTLIMAMDTFKKCAMDHPLLSVDIMHLSLDWNSRIKDLVLPSGGRLTCSFQKTLTKLVFLLHGNMQGERPALAHVQVLFYTTVRFVEANFEMQTNDSQVGSELIQLVLTDTHLCLLRENAIYYPPPRFISMVAHQAQFEIIHLRRRSDVRCVLVRDGYGSVCLDVVLACAEQKSSGTRGHPQPPWVCGADEAVAQSNTNSDSSPQNEVWKLTFSSSTEATFLINNLSNV